MANSPFHEEHVSDICSHSMDKFFEGTKMSGVRDVPLPIAWFVIHKTQMRSKRTHFYRLTCEWFDESRMRDKDC